MVCNTMSQRQKPRLNNHLGAWGFAERSQSKYAMRTTPLAEGKNEESPRLMQSSSKAHLAESAYRGVAGYSCLYIYCPVGRTPGVGFIESKADLNRSRWTIQAILVFFQWSQAQ